MIDNFDGIVQSTFQISFNGTIGTAFCVRVSLSYIGFLTCKHLFDSVEDKSVVDISITTMDDDIQYQGRLFLSDTDDAAFVLIENEDFVCRFNTIDIGIRSYVNMGDEVFTVGFPFIFKKNIYNDSFVIGDARYPMGIFRHGYVASVRFSDKDDMTQSGRILLDLYNNIGFSGSLVFRKAYNSNNMRVCYAPIGLLAGYYYDKHKVDGVSKIDDHANSHIAYCASFSGLLDKVILSLGLV